MAEGGWDRESAGALGVRWGRTTVRWVGRHPLGAGAGIVIAVLVTVGLSGGLSGGPSATKGSASREAGPAVTTQGSSATGSPTSAAGPAETAQPSSATGSPASTVAPSPRPPGFATSGAGAAAGALPGLPSKVIKSGSLDLQVPAGRLISTMAQMGSESAGLGGFVASSATSSATQGTPASGDITLRVPVQSFDILLSDMQHLGRASSISTSGQDVTAQYVDLQARIQSLQAARNQFQQILTRAQTIGDILAVEQQITTQQTQIEQLQGQLKVLDDQSSYSTLSVHVVEATTTAPVRPPRPANGLVRAWRHALHSFTRGAESIVAFSGGLVLFLLVVAVLGVLARLVWVLGRRRTAATPTVTAPPPD